MIDIRLTLGDLLHLLENHGGNFLRGESGLFAVDINLDLGLTLLGDNLEGEVFLQMQ